MITKYEVTLGGDPVHGATDFLFSTTTSELFARKVTIRGGDKELVFGTAKMIIKDQKGLGGDHRFFSFSACMLNHTGDEANESIRALLKFDPLVFDVDGEVTENVVITSTAIKSTNVQIEARTIRIAKALEAA